MCVLSNCSEAGGGGTLTNPQSKQSQSSLAGVAVGGRGIPPPAPGVARWKLSSPGTPTAAPHSAAQSRSVFIRLPQSSTRGAAKRVRASLQLVLGQKLLFQLLIRSMLNLGIFVFFEV